MGHNNNMYYVTDIVIKHCVSTDTDTVFLQWTMKFFMDVCIALDINYLTVSLR